MARAAPPSKAKPARSWKRSSAIREFFRATRSGRRGALPISRRTRPFLPTTSCCSAKRKCGRTGRPRRWTTTRPIPAPFDPSAKIEWSPVWSLRDERFKYLPTSLFYFFYRAQLPFGADSNGCAAGNTLEEAIVQGFLELVERDAYAIWWYNRLQRPEVDLGQFDDSYIRDLRSQFAANRPQALGARHHQRSRHSDLCRDHALDEDGRENIEFGSGAHFDARIAMLRALTELNQFLSFGLMGGGTGEKSSLDGITPLRLEDHPYLIPSGRSVGAARLRLEVRPSRQREQVTACVELASKRASISSSSIRRGPTSRSRSCA